MPIAGEEALEARGKSALPSPGSRRRGERRSPGTHRSSQCHERRCPYSRLRDLLQALGGIPGWAWGRPSAAWQVPPLGTRQLETAVSDPWVCRFKRGYLYSGNGLVTRFYTCCEAPGRFGGERRASLLAASGARRRAGPGLIWRRTRMSRGCSVLCGAPGAAGQGEGLPAVPGQRSGAAPGCARSRPES